VTAVNCLRQLIDAVPGGASQGDNAQAKHDAGNTFRQMAVQEDRQRTKIK
jgi:hypothetical protein